MARAVTAVSGGRGARAQSGERDPALEQLAKFFPIETSGPYLAISTVFIQGTNAHTISRTVELWVTFGVLLVATFVFLLKLYPDAEYKHRWVPITIGIGAFTIWAYASGGLAQEIDLYNAGLALGLPALYAVVASLYVPEKRRIAENGE
ncbi:hypothetical protein OG883_41995 [Streptomyces sp. NBC_01142]|uniref:hypothetical protein n=1 Tax=Streptomyces sp. NBC_01142 TaxID=2975865 RepID=UPI0022503104|nr:hypothetical protein [Streptomyces sp. NBC_01142]MCX4826234.1 hypothetical protein [Streptomyces sp. NBC_01142]